MLQMINNNVASTVWLQSCHQNKLITLLLDSQGCAKRLAFIHYFLQTVIERTMTKQYISVQ